MTHKMANEEQFELWNEGIGKKWVEEDDSMNERLSILTKELFLRLNISRGDKILVFAACVRTFLFLRSHVLCGNLQDSATACTV